MFKLVKLSLVFIGALFAINTSSIIVHADDSFYTNKNGVSMTEEQYNFLGELYFDGYQEYVTQDKFNKYLSMGLYDEKVYKKEIEDFDADALSPKALIHETTAKKLTLAYSCSGKYCTMVTGLDWKGIPKVISYDVIGSYLYGNLTRMTNPTTFLYWSGQSIEFTDRVYSGTGYGCTALLQKSSVLMSIVQDVDIYVNGSGTFYSSYQHATKRITLETSKKYTTGFGGYGGVFFFYGSAVGVYDQMGGVDVHLS